MVEPRKLASGSYQARERIAGTKEYRSLGTYATEAEALKVQLLAEHGIRPQEPTAEDMQASRGGERFDLFAERHLRARQHALADGTWLNYERMLAKWIVPTFGRMRLREIRPAHVEEWFLALPATPQRKQTYWLLHSILRRAERQGEIAKNPCQVEDVSAIKSRKRAAWSLGDFHMLVEAAKDDQERALLWTLLGTGGRIGEVLALNWSHIDLDTGEVIIDQHLTRWGMREGTKHHDDQERTVALPSKVVQALRAHAGTTPRLPDDPVFLNSRGVRLSYHAAYSRFAKLRASVALDELKPHDLRHLSLTLYAQNGATMAELMARGGHTDHRSALTYQHASRERDRAIVAAMDGAFA